MANIKIMGEALVIKSSIKAADVALLKKTKPEALTLVEGEGRNTNTLFAVEFKANSNSVSPYGIVFGSVDADDNCVCTLMLPAGADREAYVADKLTKAMIHLNAIEIQVQSAAETQREMMAEVLAQVTFVD